MSVRKQGRFEALCYDAQSDIPVLKFRGRLDINSRPYLVHVEQGSDGSVSVDLSAENRAFFNFLLCPRGLVAIRYSGDDVSYLSRTEFIEKSGMSVSDVSGLAKLLKREAVGLFGNSAVDISPSLNYLRSAPFISKFRAVLHRNLEPLLEDLEIDPEDRVLIYNSVMNSYAQMRRSGSGQ